MSKKGEFKRKCALKTCRKEFTTDDPRKIYHSRGCGNKKRSKDWYAAAAAALRSLRQGSKLKSVISVEGAKRALVGKVLKTKARAKAKPKRKAIVRKTHKARKPRKVSRKPAAKVIVHNPGPELQRVLENL